ncbi:MAG: glycerophosphodiester phosphodiesterase family protein [Nocardioides sp.]
MAVFPRRHLSDRDPGRPCTGRHPLVIAHRGASGQAPENTLAAVRAAAAGAHAVEGDVHRTRDGQLVVIHDLHLRRTTDAVRVFPTRAPWLVADFDQAELARLDAGSWFAPHWAGATIPTLHDWAAAAAPARLLVEVKHPRRYPGIEHDLVAALHRGALRAAVRAQRVTVQSFDHDWVAALRVLEPAFPVGLPESRPTGRDLDHAAWFAQQVNPAVRVADATLVRQAQDRGLEVHLWTADGRRHHRRAVRWGVDGIITNHPLRLLHCPSCAHPLVETRSLPAAG